ncbi:MAG TPA: hypothetical protein ENI97_15185 [Gammaproteobacteria bacterium]|nr:hypothetical protein [Gammaproteobacteria bacterium]
MSRLTEKKFLDEIAFQANALRKEIEAHKLGLAPSPAAVAARRQRVLRDGDFSFFVYTYFPHHLWGEPSKFQAHFCARFPQLLRRTEGCREWWVAPRGEAKSSLLTKLGPTYAAVIALLQRPEIRAEVKWQGEPPPFIDYIVLLGAETKMPTKLMEVTKSELTLNPNLALDFPEVCGKGPVWKVGECITRTGVKLEPFGAEQAIRGTFSGASRPKLLLGDDLITDKEAKSPTERDNRWNWLEKAVDYLGPPDGSVKYCGVGTVLNNDDPVSRAKRTVGHVVHHFKAIEQLPVNMDLWEQCETVMRNEDPVAERKAADDGGVINERDLPSFRFYAKRKKKMDKGAVTSWPAVRSLFWLMRQRAKNPRAFGTEMQGEARNEEDAVFTRWNFWVQRLPHWLMFGACDPSMGKGEASDPSAILVGGYDTRLNKLHVIDASIKRRVPSKLEADLISAQREYGCQAWGFENNSAFEHMRMTFIESALRAGVVLPLHGVTATVAPEVRIDSLEPFVCDIDPKILFHSSLTLLLAELKDWPEPQPHHHYDGLVALHILWVIAVARSGGIPKIISQPRHTGDSMAHY